MQILLSLAAVLLIALTASGRFARAQPATPPQTTIGVEAEAFPLPGDWEATHVFGGTSGGQILFGGALGAKDPAVAAVNLPRAGRFRLWVRTLDFPT